MNIFEVEYSFPEKSESCDISSRFIPAIQLHAFLVVFYDFAIPSNLTRLKTRKITAYNSNK